MASTPFFMTLEPMAGLGSPGLENCTDNFTALPLNARKVIKLTVGIITN